MTKKSFEAEIMSGMQHELTKNVCAEKPDLSKAAECLHAALEILEAQGLQARADQVLDLLEKIAASKQEESVQLPSVNQLMSKGFSQKDLINFANGNIFAQAKLTYILENMGYSEEMIVEAVHGKKKDHHTKGLTPAKQVENLKDHGTQFNLSKDMTCAIDIPKPLKSRQITKDDLDVDFADMLDGPVFDLDEDDDQMSDFEINDSLEVLDKEIPLEDFEDERN